jgi:hypothetical protein
MRARLAGVLLMSLASRLLMACGGSGSFATGIPTDASWTRHDPLVVIAPTQAWEETSIQEPNVDA